MKQGFRWCSHCGKPHSLETQVCEMTGLYLDAGIHKPTPQSFILPGTVIDGKYRILEALGTGGMGIVFDAISLTLDRRVAVKVVAGYATNEARKRLVREARILTKLQHPNICDVYDVGTMPNGNPYLVLERLHGITLGSRIAREGPLPVAEAVDVFVQILSGLQVAHGRRILHRDLKPHNIFLSARAGCAPIASIVDFGLALDLTDVRLTRPGRACGTPHYMSPDQLEGQIIDDRSDVFSAGVSLYEALTGQHPFLGRNADETRERILRDEPVPLRRRRRDVPNAVAQAVMWALRKNRADRPATALAFQQALRAATAPTRAVGDARFDNDEEPTSTRPLWRPSDLTPSA